MRASRLYTNILLLIILVSSGPLIAQEKVLVFASYEETYYSEYIVMTRALEAMGYEVDVRSSGTDSISIYMLPEGTDIEETAGTLPNGNYSQFTNQFLNLFGENWDSEDNETPNHITINGSLLDIQNMDEYVALVVIGGTGALDYRVDGEYDSQGVGEREISATTVQLVAEKLNSLALDALLNGKPVIAQCHGASIPAFWRIPNTEASGIEALGISLIKGGIATGFPEPETPTVLAELGITHRANDRVTVTSPHSLFEDNGTGDFKIITTRDWYPQTVAHAARTLANIIETYPAMEELEEEVSVLILHGGEVDINNCSASNRDNDVPCNYGTGDNLPADFTDLETLLVANSSNDNYSITVSEFNILDGSFPSSESELNSLFEDYDAIIWYKHWSTGVTEELQNALVSYADDGGGVIGLHHGLYNDIDGSRDKDILVQELFGVQSSQSGWSGNLTNFSMVSTGYGHFISTYEIEYDNSIETPSPWLSTPLPSFANASYSYYQEFQIFDEIYNNMSFENDVIFGSEVNEVTPLFSNNQEPHSQSHTNSFAKLFNASDDESIGRVVFFEAGERIENYDPAMPYGQLVRNAVVWSANKNIDSTSVSIWDEVSESPSEFRITSFYPNPFNPSGTVQFQLPKSGEIEVMLFDILGREVQSIYSGPMNSGIQSLSIDGVELSSGIYIVRVTDGQQVQTIRITLIK